MSFLFERLASSLLVLIISSSLAFGYTASSQVFVSELNPQGNETTPRGIHLSSQKGPATSVTISWYTEAPADSVAEYGNSFPPSNKVTGRATKSPVSNIVLHEVLLEDLTPGTVYFYRVGDPSKRWSEYHRFSTAPRDLSARFNFSVWGDQSTSEQAKLVVERAKALNPGFHLHTGDLSYAGPNEANWNKWFDLIEPFASEAMYFPAVGNHEFDADPDLVNFYLPRFALPDDERSYGLRWGNALILTVDFGPRQHAPKTDAIPWLKEALDLAAKEQSITWRIIFIHYPLYSTYRDTQDVRNILQPIVDNHNVDLVLAGHDHFYERSYPLRADCIVSRNQTGYALEGATIHVTTGGGGASLYRSAVDTPPNWRKAYASEFHFLWIDVAKNQLTLKAIRTNDGTTLDEFTVTKTSSGSTTSQTCVEKVSTTMTITTTAEQIATSPTSPISEKGEEPSIPPYLATAVIGVAVLVTVLALRRRIQQNPVKIMTYRLRFELLSSYCDP